jgi:hypothetical protein
MLWLPKKPKANQRGWLPPKDTTKSIFWLVQISQHPHPCFHLLWLPSFRKIIHLPLVMYIPVHFLFNSLPYRMRNRAHTYSTPPWQPRVSFGCPARRKAVPSGAAPSRLGVSEKGRELSGEGCGRRVVHSTVFPKVTTTQPNGFWLSHNPHRTVVFHSPWLPTTFSEATAQPYGALISFRTMLPNIV